MFVAIFSSRVLVVLFTMPKEKLLESEVALNGDVITLLPWVCCLNFVSAGIPTLVILDKDGKTITTKGRSAVAADPEGKVRHTFATCQQQLS